MKLLVGGFFVALLIFATITSATGLTTLEGEWAAPVDQIVPRVDASGNVTIVLSFLDDRTQSATYQNPKAYELAHSMYSTGRYRLHDASTDETLDYYMVARPYSDPSVTHAYGYDVYVSVNKTRYSGWMRATYDENLQIDVKNKNAVAFAFTNESYNQTQGTWLGSYGRILREIDVGTYDTAVVSSMSILTNGNGTSGASAIFFHRPRVSSWGGASGFWSENDTIFTLQGRQNSTTWAQTGAYSNRPTVDGVGSFAIEVGISGFDNTTTTQIRAAPYVNGSAAGWQKFNITATAPPVYTYFNKLYIGNGEYYFADFIGFVHGGGRYIIRDSSIYEVAVAPEQVVISGPTQAFVSDEITLSAAVYPLNEWAQEVTWTHGGAYLMIAANATSATFRCYRSSTEQNTTITATAHGVSSSVNVDVVRPALAATIQHGQRGTPTPFPVGATQTTYYTGEGIVDRTFGRVGLNISLTGVPSSWYDLQAADRLIVEIGVDSAQLDDISNPNRWMREFMPIRIGTTPVNITIERNSVPLYSISSAWNISTQSPTASIQAPVDNTTVLEQGQEGNNSFWFNWTSVPAYQPLVIDHALDPGFTNIIASDQYQNWDNPYAGRYDGSVNYVVDTWEPGIHYFRLRTLTNNTIDIRSIQVDGNHSRGPISIEVLDTSSGQRIPGSRVTLQNDTSTTYWNDTEASPGLVEIPAEGLIDPYTATVYAGGYESESLTVLPGNNYTVYLVTDNTSAYIRFSLIDNTGDYPRSSSRLLITPQFGGAFDPLYFDAAGEAGKRLTIGQNYSLAIVNESGSVRQAGFIIPLGNQTIQLVIGDLLLQKTNGSWGNFSYNLQLIRRSANEGDALTDYTAVLNWSRSEGYTGDAYMTITNTNTSAVVDSVNMTSQTGDRVFQIPYTSDLYQIMLRWYDNGTWYEDVRYITPQKALDALAISPTVRNIVCLCLLFIIALVFSQINAQIGAVIILATAAVMYAIGALIITPYVLFCVALIPVVALLGNRYLRGG